MTVHSNRERPAPACEISAHFPPFFRRALVNAATAHWKSEDERLKDIDAITDQLAVQGLCRKREDVSRAAEWSIGRAPR